MKRRILAPAPEGEPGLTRWQIFGVVMLGLAIIAFVAGSMPSSEPAPSEDNAASSASAAEASADEASADDNDSAHPTQYFYGVDSAAPVLQGFHTYNGKPLPELLKGLGLSITRLEVTPIESFGSTDANDRAGDLVYTLVLSGQVHLNAPCRLAQLSHNENAMSPEFIRRGSAFPLVRPADDDAVIYWAATGSCQPE